MLTFVSSGVPALLGFGAAGLVVGLRKLSVALHSVLQLSDELDPVRPMVASGSRTSSTASSNSRSDTIPHTESLARLSNALERLNVPSGTAESTGAVPDAPVAHGIRD
jgi:hypothetical protein